MSYFKISLLTPQITNGQMQYLESTISEFFNQSDEFNAKQGKEVEALFTNSNKYSFCYTFNEKLEIHKNAQKQLTFSITKYIFINDEWLLNPFASALHIGTQVLLTDKDHNEYFFTIKNIAFSLGLTNITYNITCQDSFSYQTITQNDGYTINNDPSSEDFIGARDIDYWVKNHIAHDCYIGYDYLPLGTGIYLENEDSEGNEGDVKTYQYGEPISNVKKIIKEAYSPKEHSEYFETFPFAVSGSNASAALIALGEEIGLMLNTYEKRIPNTNRFHRYYWFEPTRNEYITGLTYSPYRDVQNFDFSFGGESLVTVLNIEAQANAEEELITLIPPLPQFFMNVIQTQEFWDNSYYSKNFFSSLCKNKTLWITRDLQNDFKITNINYYDGYLELVINATAPIFYSYVNFETDNEQSYLLVDNTYLNPRNSVWSLYKLYKQDGKDIYTIIGTQENPLTNDEWNKPCTYKIRIQSNGISTSSVINNYKLYLNFYRNVTKEEIDFAEIADKCPWLENKIIDFSYFYNQNIINRQEYQELMSLISNDLRIANGKLLLYSNEYKNALKDKIKAVSDITNDLDSVGAAFQADVVDVYASDGTIDNISYFNNAYNTVFGSDRYNMTNKKPLLDYENLLTQYGNKYFSSRQRFLKNIYKFRDYFNSPITWGDGNSAITKYDIRLNSGGSLQFKDNSFTPITNDGSPLPSTVYDKNYMEYTDPIVTNKNYGQFYVPTVHEGDFIFIDGDAKYDSKNKYYRAVYEFEGPITDDKYIRYPNENGKYYYVPLAAAQSLGKAESTITVGGLVGKLVYLPVTLTEMISDYIYYKQKQYYYHTEVDYSPVQGNFLTQEALQKLFKDYVSHNIFIYTLDIDEEELLPLGSINYQRYFPLDTLYYYGPKFDSNGVRLNSKNLTQTQYDESPDGESPSSYECYQSFSIVNNNNENTFFRRKRRGSRNLWDLTSNVKYDFEGNKESDTDNGLHIFYSKVDKGYDEYKKFNHDDKYLYNYYNIIGLTYANVVSAGISNSEYMLSAGDLERLYYKDSYLVTKHSGDIVSSSNNYRILYLDKYTVQDGKESDFANQFKGRFSKIINYPIYDASEEISLVKYDGKTLLEALNGVFNQYTIQESNGYFIANSKYSSTLTKKFLIFKEEPYNWEEITLKEDKSNRFAFASKPVFDLATDSKVQFSSFDDLTKGFYISAKEQRDFKKVSELESVPLFNADTIYYKKNDDDTYTRLYTELQLKASGLFYASNSTTARQITLKNNTSAFDCQMVTNDGKDAGVVTLICGEYDGNNQATGTVSKNIGEKEYSVNFTITRTIKDTISNLTKGQFWYKFHSSVDMPVIFEEAACIETELTTYWTQAVNASKYCEFFLPDSWQPIESGNTNYFKDKLYTIEDNTIQLLDNGYIPKVSIFELNGKIILPKYELRYRKGNEPGVSAAELKDINPIAESFKTIEESLSNWIAEENGTTTYYDYIGGGVKWNDLLGVIKSGYSTYPRFDGLYVMTYWILKNCYLPRTTIRYDQAIAKHNAVWKQIYTNYQGLLLEGTYSNENATTPQELYTLASYYMKDITQPEKGYNITVIDISNLEGYVGQELKIGSSIQINTNEYYDDYDDVAKAISQPLFITDISYELRKDSDIQLTVNIVKYQDKLIQRLVKLIK